mmetsp:Transcript_40589/g.101533  ORF Transcript_40589/g.101533 Transcript_40589/m.101533 type:complete len:217 (-) Transcript_40589:90-740(-)
MLTPLSSPSAPGGAAPGRACLLPLDHEEMACDTTSSLSSTSLDTALPSPPSFCRSCLRSASAAPSSRSRSPCLPPFLPVVTGSSTPERLPAISGGAMSPPLRILTAEAAGREAAASAAGLEAERSSIDEAGSEKAGLALAAAPPASPSSITPPRTRRGAAEGPRAAGAVRKAPGTPRGAAPTVPPFFAISKSSTAPRAAAAMGARWAAASRLECVL